jgi:LysR family transcriptional regulator, carnitine catabolism transcriptional activator
MIHDLRHIRAFLALARAGSFTRAAVELHMSQPTLTVQIQHLETAVGVKLFDRSKRHVALTQAGRDLLVPLERILIDVEAIAANTDELLAHRRGLVTVAALPSVAAGLLPRAIRKLSESYPGITVRVFDGVASRVAAMVKGGQVDFGISSQTYGDRELTSQVLIMDRLCAVVATDHALTKKRSMTLHELARHPLILMLKDSSSRQIVDLAFNREGLVSNVAYETTYGSTVAGLAQAGLGVGILPESMVGPSPLHQLRIRGGALTRRISIIMRAGRSLSPTAGKLTQTLEMLAQADLKR